MIRTAAAALWSHRKRKTPVWGLVALLLLGLVCLGGSASAKRAAVAVRRQRPRAAAGALSKLGTSRPAPGLRATSGGEPFKYATAFGDCRALLGDRSSGSAVVRMGVDDNWLEFMLAGSAGSTSSLTGGKLVFNQAAKRTVTYERLDNGIKENIVLSTRPKSPAIAFRFRQSDLTMKRRRNGYHFFAPGKDELFWVKNPVVYDANGVQGGATLRILGSRAIIRVDDKFLAQAKYPIIVDPTIVATASQASPAGLPIERHIVRTSAGTLVFFYQSGVGLEYKTSTDNGSSWSSPITISATTSNELAACMSAANDIYLTYRGSGGRDYIFFRKLTYSGGSWTVGAERTVESGGNDRRYPCVVREAGGRIWVSYWRRTGSAYSILVRSSTDEGVTWSAATTIGNTNAQGSASMELYQGRPVIVYEVNDASLDVRFWTGAAWTAAQTVVAGNFDDGNWGSLAATTDGRLHLVYAQTGGGLITYTVYNGTSWSSPYGLSSAPGDRYPSVSTDGTRLWAFWSQYVGPNQRRIVYRKYSSGSWDTGPKPVTGLDEDEFAKALVFTSVAAPSCAESLTASSFVASGTAQNWRADDQSWNYTLPFSFPFYDTTRTTVWVCSNGFLDFTSNNTDPTNTTAEMRTRVMVCGMWDDIRTDMAGQPGEDIYVYQPDANSVVLRWVGETYGTGYPVNFAIRLYSDGRISFDYGSGNTNLTPTVGVSSGDGVHYTLSAHDGSSVLTNAQTSYWTRDSASNWLDRTSEAASTATGDVNLFNANGDALYVGSVAKFDYTYFDLQTGASASIAPSWEYWNGTGWQALTLTENPGYTFTGSGRVGFTPPANWQTCSVGGSANLYYVRATRTAPTVATPPLASQFTSVRNNIQPTSASSDASAIPVGWSEGVASPYTVRFASVPLVDITMSIVGTYDRSGAFHGSPPYGVDFGDMDPDVGTYVVGTGAGAYAAAFQVVSDSNWDMTVQADGDLRDGTGNTAPISNLRWTFDGSGAWTSFVKTPATGTVLTGQPANFPTGSMVYFDYQFSVDWMTEPSAVPYGATLMYSAIQQ